MRYIAFDFEVFRHLWMVTFIDYENQDDIITITNDSNLLKEYYEKNKNNIFIGYNSRNYDVWIFKAILADIDPYFISKKLIDGFKGYHFIKNDNDFQIYNFDLSDKFRSLKELEGFLGSTIKETTVSFELDRPLTNEEIDEVKMYNIHDVKETIKVLRNQEEELQAQKLIINAFNLDMRMFNKTKAQLAAHVLGAVRQERLDDEFDISIPDTLVISDKYKYIVDWYKNPLNMSYSKSLKTNVAGVPHVFAYGGIHGARKNYQDEGIILCCDVALF